MKAVIFGSNGQDGFYLGKILLENQVEAIPISRNGNSALPGDVSDYSTVEAVIKTHKPAFVFHLAANSTTRHETVFENNNTISLGTLNILESVKLHSPKTKVFITGSGVQFINRARPIKETDAFEASSPYSIARIQSVYAARYYRTLGIHVYVGFLFHHESPLRKSSHISKMIADKVKRISGGASEIITLGDITVKKEWGYAQDIAEGIFTLVSQENIFEATIGTGIAYSIEDWLKECFGLIGKNWEDYYEPLNTHFNAEYKLLISDPTTINSLGWFPQTSFKGLANIMLGLNEKNTGK